MTADDLKATRPGDVLRCLDSDATYLVVYHNAAGYPVLAGALVAIDPRAWERVDASDYDRHDLPPRDYPS